MYDYMENEMFSGVYAKNGYFPLIEHYVKGCKKVFILKGTPGCGKSTLLKRLCTYADNKQVNYDIIKCSSDYNSLDGVIFKDSQIAVVDGTAPHIIEDSLPILKHITVNLVQGCDETVVKANAIKLFDLNNIKRNAYSKAYALVNAYEYIDSCLSSLLGCAIDNHAIDKFCKNIIDKQAYAIGTTNIKALSCICSEGFMFLKCFDAKKTIVLKDKYGISQSVLYKLYCLANDKKKNVTFVPSPLNIERPIALHFTNEKLLIVSDRYSQFSESKTVNCDRFTDKAKISVIKGKIKLFDRIQKDIILALTECFEEASSAHKELETVYTFANDFSVSDNEFDIIRNSIFKE